MTNGSMESGQGSVELFGERIRDARAIRRMPSKDIAQKVEIRPERLTRLERSVSTTVSPVLVKRFGSALGFPWQFFVNEPVTAVLRDSLLFRAKRSMRVKEQEKLATWTRMIGDVLDA